MQKKSVQIHVWHLELTDAPEETCDTPYRLEQVRTPMPELNRFLYTTVGAPWNWYMRLDWDWYRWHEYLEQTSIETWIAYMDGAPIGYFELDHQSSGSTEIAYFGLLPQFVGMGLGKPLLKDAIARAWAGSGKRVWLHTCTLDHPNALPNYLARGFRVFKEEDFEDLIPAEPLQPWRGAAKPDQLAVRSSSRKSG